ncbi:Na+/H+ antiporter NhaC family protein [Candidatus Uabimicrobium amorphum]|uniref:Sodium:proton antiporter n=1 Tax=Uabimicrobium amorphum TaxID=2596890 RepID=A0A5S9IVY1_UABAM|nr:Na+/H+ antiporter NhaC family protein [Candidatus Uabimicrobium amorphum]BBM88080.1 sodium:proton antiporter [Candidatus Uabimicrobium amorphum]
MLKNFTCVFLLMLSLFAEDVHLFKIDKVFANNTPTDIVIYTVDSKNKPVDFASKVSIEGLEIPEEQQLVFAKGKLALKNVKKLQDTIVIDLEQKKFTVVFPVVDHFTCNDLYQKNIPQTFVFKAVDKDGKVIDYTKKITLVGVKIFDDTFEEMENSVPFKAGSATVHRVKVTNDEIHFMDNDKKYSITPPTFDHFAIKDYFANNLPRDIVIHAKSKSGKVLNYNKKVIIENLELLNKKDKVYKKTEFQFKKGVLKLEKCTIKGDGLIIKEKDSEFKADYSSFSPFWTLVPPLLAILLAIITKEVLLSLFVGVWSAVFIMSGFDIAGSLLDTFTVKLVATLSEHEYVQVIVFTCTIGGMIGIVSKSGGIHDLVEKISLWATSPRNGMISTWLMGVVIFFDDYANTLIVGNSMRAITDKLKISREKLAYIVDSTAAPVCSIVLISTWIGTELGYIGGALQDYGQGKRAFDYFFNSIPFHFYSIYTIIFVYYIASSQKDYGPMLQAEKRARSTGEVLGPNAVPLSTAESIEAPEGKPHRWQNAVIPIAVVIVATMIGLYIDGSRALGEEAKDAALMNIIGEANSYVVLLWAAFWGSLSAFVIIVAQNILTAKQVVDAWVGGAKAMLLAVLVLILAWTLKDVCKELGTNKYIYYNIKDIISVKFLPTIGFLTSAVVAFATGTSWGTMGLLFPLLIPLGVDLSQQQLDLALDLNNYILLGTLGSVLAGATLGDHCSPISDTTVMSSMASSCDHIDHVKTQTPYALTCGIISCVFGYIPIGFGAPVWLCLILGIAAIIVSIRVLGKESV